jgi:hypothetical protein
MEFFKYSVLTMAEHISNVESKMNFTRDLNEVFEKKNEVGG